MSQFQFFDPFDLRRFYTTYMSSRSLLQAVLLSVREEDWEVEAEEDAGRVLVRFRLPGESWERSFVMVWEGESGLEMAEGPLLTDSQVWCDMCGDSIQYRPVAVFLGSHALCPSFRDLTSLTLAEAAEMDGVEIQWID
ncbi:hypothetical protein HRbin27_01491 [bacterium HR27]|nr:hypothetical protein HRbin27_01491 [bacterium HR27]